MFEPSDKSHGRLLTALLAGSWRPAAPPFDCSAAELEEIAPLLLKSGAAALVWRRIRHSPLRDLPAAQEFHQAYRLYALQAALHQRTIEQVLQLLRSIGIEPVLIKGWAAARLYPEQGLRPYGDIDLCVRPEQLEQARAALKTLPEERLKVDLHRGLEKFGDRDFDAIHARSQVVMMGETKVRVLSAEDHLRVLCLHLLREGAWRPLWLCDIAAAVESRPIGFDWNRCLGGKGRQADWIICSIALAEQLLCADVSDALAAAGGTREPPRWLTTTILKEWQALTPQMPQRHLSPMGNYLRRPAGIFKGLRHHWPNPIEATINMRGPLNNLPRLPFQLGNCLARTARFAARLPKLIREQ
jgi:hypothetical protein